MPAPQPIMVIVVGTLMGRLTARIGSKMVLVWGAVACSAAMVVAGVAHDRKWEIYLVMALLGVGIGMVIAAQANISVTTVPPEQTGVAAGMNANIRLIGGSIGVAAVITSSASNPLGLPTGRGYTLAFAVVAVVSALGAAVTVLLPDTTRGPTPEPFSTAALGLAGSAPPLPENN